jgi:hypothetical protein
VAEQQVPRHRQGRRHGGGSGRSTNRGHAWGWGVQTGNGSWAVCYGPGRVNSAFSELNQIFSNVLELIQSKDGFPVLENFKIKYSYAGN